MKPSSKKQKQLGEWHLLELAGRAKYNYLCDPTRENLEAFHKAYLQFLNSPTAQARKDVMRFSAEILRPVVTSQSSQFLEPDYFQDQSDISLRLHPRFYQTQLHSHDFFECIYVYSGNCENTLGNQLILMEEGDFCIIPPNQAHQISSYQEDSVVINLLIRKSTFQQSFQPFFSDSNLVSNFFLSFFYNKQMPYLFFRCEQDPVLRDLLQTMYDQREEPSNSDTMRSLFLSLVAHLSQSHLQHVIWFGDDRPDQPPPIVKMLQYISDHLTTVTLQSLAQEFGYCSTSCSNFLKKATGKTFSCIIREEKARQAAKLLLDSTNTIPQIAEMLNFYDISHFYRAFSSVYGVTPAQYRKEHQGSK